MSPSISFRELTDGTDAVLDRLDAHNDGIVISYDGEDVARITPLSAEERAWRRTLIAEGEDPDAPENAMELRVADDERPSELDRTPGPERPEDPDQAPDPGPARPEQDPAKDPTPPAGAERTPTFAAHEYGEYDPDLERPVDASAL